MMPPDAFPTSAAAAVSTLLSRCRSRRATPRPLPPLQPLPPTPPHPSPTAFSYNVALRLFASSRPGTSLRLFLRMLRAGLRPDAYTLPFLLPAAARWPAPAPLQKLGLRDHDHTAHSLVTAFSCLGDPRAARMVFDGIPRRDVVSWNSMMKAYGRAGTAAEVEGMFRAMVEEGAAWPNGATVAVMLAACREAGDLALGRWVEERVRSAGMERWPRHDLCLMASRTRVLWRETPLSLGYYAQNGMSTEAIALFHCMREAGVPQDKITLVGILSSCATEPVRLTQRPLRQYAGIQPDDITFIGVLCACVHAGLLEYGRQLFSSPTPEFRIIPKIEQYSCMVDLLAPWDFIEKIPGKVDAVMLGALLAACRKCKNVEVGEKVVNRIIKLEPPKSWNYVVSSKIYATSNMGISKTPGCSWVEVSGKVLEFYASTEPHHGEEDMYQLMGILLDEMRFQGYVPNLDLV
ncbi:hypothetical protein BS78_05G197500 [Paspalum vaginatum]|nr:hypothetical protein BS78_05G197500 [Paspalum vaginatum]